MSIEVIATLIAIGVGICGYILGRLHTPKIDGRLVINEKKDEYFIAITTKPEELKKRSLVRFKVIKQ